MEDKFLRKVLLDMAEECKMTDEQEKSLWARILKNLNEWSNHNEKD